MRQTAKGFDRPTATIAARWSAIRGLVARLHHARVGMTAKTLSNHKSNLRAALRWFVKRYDVPRYGVHLSPKWERFHEALDERVWTRLSNLVRHCSARGIAPAEVNDEVFRSYWDFRTETTGLATNNTAKRFMIRAWNSCAVKMDDGSVLQRLTEPPLKAAEPAWEAFPAGLRHAIDSYLSGLARVHRVPPVMWLEFGVARSPVT